MNRAVAAAAADDDDDKGFVFPDQSCRKNRLVWELVTRVLILQEHCSCTKNILRLHTRHAKFNEISKKNK